jgi:hypothetical protein
MKDLLMDSLMALPESVKSAGIGAALGAGGAMLMGEGDSLASYAISYGLLSAVACYAAPMVIDDKSTQPLAAAGVGAGAKFLLPASLPGSMLMAAAVPAGAVYVSRMSM